MLIYKLRRAMTTLFFKTNPVGILLMLIGYFISSYVLLALAGEKALLNPADFFYWMIVTASTVGYGDYSPSTPLGKLLVSLWVIPLGLSSFAFILAKAGIFLSDITLRSRKGTRMLKNKNHTVIIGWNGARTLRLIDLLLAKGEPGDMDIVLVVRVDIENPLPDRIGFVKVDSFTHEPSMKRANLEDAASVIIDTDLDDVTLTTALFCEKINPKIHTTVYFQDESIGDLLKTHCESVECIPSVSVEMLANAAIDPGSSMLQKQLLDSTCGMTQYTLKYTGQTTAMASMFERFKKEFSATIIGLKPKDKDNISINPALDMMIFEGDTLFYIAQKRLSSTCLS